MGNVDVKITGGHLNNTIRMLAPNIKVADIVEEKIFCLKLLYPVRKKY